MDVLNKTMKYILLNTKTGKIVDAYDGDKVILVDRKQEKLRREMALRKKERALDKRGNFLFANTESIMKLKNTNLSLKDKGYLMQLLIYSKYDGKPLSIGRKPLTVKKISEIWGLSLSVTRVRMNKFLKNDIFETIKDEDDGRKNNFILNRNVFAMGSLKSAEKRKANFIKIYHRELKSLIKKLIAIEENQGETGAIDSLGLLFCLLPYYHFETYFLVNNPYYRSTKNREEQMTENEKLEILKHPGTSLKYLSKRQIGIKTGKKNMNMQTISKYLKWLQKAGAIISMKNNGRQLRYMINPELCYRKDDRAQDPYSKRVSDLFAGKDSKLIHDELEMQIEINNIVSFINETRYIDKNYKTEAKKILAEAKNKISEMI